MRRGNRYSLRKGGGRKGVDRAVPSWWGWAFTQADQSPVQPTPPRLGGDRVSTRERKPVRLASAEPQFAQVATTEVENVLHFGPTISGKQPYARLSATLQRCNASSLRLFLLHAPTACPPHLLDHRPKPELTVSGTAMRHGRPWLPWSVQGPGPARSNRILSQFTSKTTNWRLGQSIRRRSEGKAGFGALGPGFSMSCTERRRARF